MAAHLPRGTLAARAGRAVTHRGRGRSGCPRRVRDALRRRGAGNKAIGSPLVQYRALDSHVRPTADLAGQILAAVFLAHAARVRSLLRRHPRLATKPDGRGDQPVHHAARNGDTEIVRLLIEHGADVNAANTRGHTVLYCAGGHGHLDTTQLLLDEGADCDASFTHDGKTLMEWLV